MTGNESTDLMAERYGTDRTGGRTVARVLSVVVIALFTGVMVWIIAMNSSPDTQIKVLTFDVIDDHRVTTDVNVHFKDPITEAVCVVQAGAQDGALVGETRFTATNGRQSVEIKTDRRATTVMEKNCTPVKD